MRVLLGVMVLAIAACSDASSPTSTLAPSTTTQPPTVTATTPIVTTVAPTTVAPTTSTTTTLVRTTLPASNPSVSLVGIPSVRVGLTIEEVRENAPFDLDGELDPDLSDTCYHVTPDDTGLAGVTFMVLDGIVARMEIRPPSTLTTRSGAGIGITESQLRAMFPGQIEQANDATSDGTAVAFVPADEVDQDYRAVFITSGGVVTNYRVGLLPAVNLQEGCA